MGRWTQFCPFAPQKTKDTLPSFDFASVYAHPMDRMAPRLVALGSILTGSGVLFGAFGTHYFKARMTAQALETYQTAVLYQLIHGIGIVLIGVLSQTALQSKLLIGSALCMACGCLVFCGSLYGYAISEAGAWAIPAPVGGLLLMIGWLLAASSAVSSARS